jgi:hypothetical protein
MNREAFGEKLFGWITDDLTNCINCREYINFERDCWKIMYTEQKITRKEVIVAYFKDPQWHSTKRAENMNTKDCNQDNRCHRSGLELGTAGIQVTPVTTDSCRGTENSQNTFVRTRSSPARDRIENFWNKTQTVYEVGGKLYYGCHAVLL